MAPPVSWSLSSQPVFLIVLTSINLALCLPCPPCSPDLQSETDWARGMLKDSEVSAGCPGWELDRWGMAECSYKASSVNVSSLVASVCVVALCDDWRWLLCGPVTLTPHALLLDLQVSGLWLGEVILLMGVPRDSVMLPVQALLPRRLY